MTRARVQALQAARPVRPPLRMVRGTVQAATASSVTVQLAGGGSVQGLPIPGAVYTVGGQVLVLGQEPAVGPVYPLPGTTAVPGVPTSASAVPAYSGTAANWDTGRTSSVTRFGTLATLNFQATIGATPPASGATIATVPTGFRPPGFVNWKATLYTGAWAGHSVDLEIGSAGLVAYRSATIALAAGHGVFGTVTYSTV